jgi:hypothetical protein
VPGAHEALALDKAVRDRATVVRTAVVDDDEPATREASHRHVAVAVARWAHLAGRKLFDIRHLDARRHGFVRIVPEQVEDLGSQRAHPVNLANPSDIRENATVTATVN